MENSTTRLEERIMASVQMSGQLRDAISRNYKKQLHAAYRQSHNVQPAVDKIIDAIQTNAFKEYVDLSNRIETIGKQLTKQYHNHKATYGQYHLNFQDQPTTRPREEIGVVCNPNRPSSDNMTYLYEWHMPDTHKEAHQDYKNGKEYVDGDVGVQINDLPEYHCPVKTEVTYMTGWGSDERYCPHADQAVFVVTDPEICEALVPIGKIEEKVNADLSKFNDYIKKITTLKRFVDEWPGGKELVPEEYMQRMAKKVVRNKATKMTPEQIIPDELKEQMNEVILTNKLLGED